jgi:glutamate racemase
VRAIYIISFLKNSLLSFSSPQKLELNEEKRLVSEIEEAKKKIHYAWNRFQYAAPEYVELAVLELLLAETHYCLLNKRYRIMLGINKSPYCSEGQLKNHAFFGSIAAPLI